MAKNKLFQELNLAHNPHRNGYDLSYRCNFTAKAGELLPLMHRTVNPGEKFRIRVNHFTRTAPLETAAQTKIREYFDFFFVPYRLLWKDAPQVHTNNLKNPVSASSLTTNKPIGVNTPNFDYKEFRRKAYPLLYTKYDSFGYNRAFRVNKLMNHLGFGFVTHDDARRLTNNQEPSVPYNGPQYLSAYPLLAYQCIYYNFYRNTQWEDNVPYNYNVDYLGTSAIIAPQYEQSSQWANYWNNPTLFDLHYSNYPKDLFYGVFPDAQFGDEAVVALDGTASPDGVDTLQPVVDSEGVQVATDPSNPQELSSNTNIGPLWADLQDLALKLNANFGILELRKQQFLQKYKEIIGSGRNDYRARIEKIFGVSVSDNMAQVPYYLGGSSSDIDVNEVVNQNLSGGNNAEIKGKGAGDGTSELIEFTVPEEHGLIMCIYHCQPVIDYATNSLHFDLAKTEYDDYANPVFDQLGFEELPSYFLDLSFPYAYDYTSGGTRYSGYNNLGYTTRYYDYKTSIDVTLGDFRETRKSWLAPLNTEYLSNFVSNGRLYLNANFFRVNPAILDPIFTLKASPSGDNSILANSLASDQFLVFTDFEVNAVRPLDYNGVPY